jgi:fused signal recognition particle receptor
VKSTVFGSKILRLLRAGKIDEAFFDELEDVLIEGDVGAQASMTVIDELRRNSRRDSVDNVRDKLKEFLGNDLLERTIDLERGKLNFILVLGVNGVGKTTSIAKLARYFEREEGFQNTLLCAADTFRAAAIEQLRTLGDRLGLKVVGQERGSDPGAVIFDSLESAVSKNVGLVLADTAGRMHNKQNLIQELQKMDKIATSKVEKMCYHKLLVIDANTGQNGLRQAEVFHDAIGVDSIMLTKYDSTAKGGIVIGISKELKIPVSFIGTGETLDDIEPFSAETFLDDLLGG